MDSSISQFLQHLQQKAEPFVLRKKAPLSEWSGESLHQQIYQSDPELYALLALAPFTHVDQQSRILFQLLRSSRAGLAKNLYYILDRVSDMLAASLPPQQVLSIFLALKRVKANHKHTGRAILRYILNHPALEKLAIQRRPTLVHCLEHALGRNTMRGCARMIATSQEDNDYVQRNLLRFAYNPQRAKNVIPFLFHQGNAPTDTRNIPLAHYFTCSPTQRPKTVTTTNRGDIAATLVHIYRGGHSPELKQALENYVEQACRVLPHYDGKLALILDASLSTKGYGEREYACISQSVAFFMVLQKCCSHLEVYQVGGTGKLPIPAGSTDIASALIQALKGNPDIIAIVSDGYENVYPGELSRVAATLPAMGISIPVVFCQSKFTDHDDISLRNPAPNLCQLEFWHQDDFENVMFTIFGMARTAQGFSIKSFLEDKLQRLEKELATWNTTN